MNNLNRRGFFGQITAFIAGYTFFPFIKKDPETKFKEANNEWGEIISPTQILQVTNYGKYKFNIGEMVYQDIQGQYVPFRKNRSNYPIGVCFSNYENGTIMQIITNRS